MDAAPALDPDQLRIRNSHALPNRVRPEALVVHASQVFPERFPQKTAQGWIDPSGDPCPEPFRSGGQFGARLLVVQKASGRKRFVAARLHDGPDKWSYNAALEKVVKEYELIFDVETWRDNWLHEYSGGKLGVKDPLWMNDVDPSPGTRAPMPTAMRT